MKAPNYTPPAPCPIGYIRSPFLEKFGIPRQPGLAPNARAVLELVAPFNREESVRGLEEFSHVWVSFHFHGVAQKEFRPMVRPPRLGGNKRLGVFATRSTHRPNAMGLSVVRLDRVDTTQGVRLFLSGVDFLDETPVLDIKPYLPWCDSIPDAQAGFAHDAPQKTLEVVFSKNADEVLHGIEPERARRLKTLIDEVITLDPRPAYLDSQHAMRQFGIKIGGYNVVWHVHETCATVETLEVL